MSMGSYPFEQKSAFVFDRVAVATALVNDYLREEQEVTDPMREELRELLLDGRTTAYRIASAPEYRDWIQKMALDSTSDAHDVLSGADVDCLVHCTEFTGSAEPSERFAAHGGTSLSFDDAFALFLVPAKAPDLFSAAYGSPSELEDEYKNALSPFLGDDFPYGSRIMDVSGIYVC